MNLPVGGANVRVRARLGPEVRTCTVYGPDPHWDELVSFLVSGDAHHPSGEIKCTVYGQGLRSTPLGSVSIDLAAWPFDRFAGTPQHLPITFFDKKHAAREASLIVEVGYIRTLGSLAAVYRAEAITDLRKLFFLKVPKPHTHMQLPVYVGLRYKQDAVDVVLLVARPDTGLSLHMELPSTTNTTVYRQETAAGERCCGGLFSYEDATIRDIPLSPALADVQLCVRERSKVPQHQVRESLDCLLARHGWPGGNLTWYGVLRRLSGAVIVDTAEYRAVYLPQDGAYVVLEFWPTSFDVKVCVQHCEGNASTDHDVVVVPSEGGVTQQKVEKVVEVFSSPRQILGGFWVQRIMQLRGLPYTTPLVGVEWRRCAVQQVVRCCLGDIIHLY